ncbi:hypothetical protein PR202_ga26331 [Eleusine coracana subsp. coracana]|uniref:Alpha/beta hydrolase fold-3 domain-containing protein n=1 Tax=Eleusine coracana subsp. coracana TaxID=191504 RepID=A0AAV5DD65_ELECO|nr:hypothetical protein PR202_ga26331 [Eleusine coracana subsp. coracana]
MGALHVVGEPTRVITSFQPPQAKTSGHGHGPVVEEIHGLIRVYKDGHVERLPAIPDVPATWGSTAPGSGGVAVARDVVVDRATGVWARLYAPTTTTATGGGAAARLPVVVYFHGGGFCVGSAAWSCYHEFLAQLAARAGCAVVSVDYRLAPEHRLPAAFDDGLAALRWLRHQAAAAVTTAADDLAWWRARCRFDRVFLAGDSAGASVAFHVAARLGQGYLGPLGPLSVRGAVLIQPFFGGEARTASEKTMAQPPRSALTLPTSDCYWRLALPAANNAAAGRDHPWCNPVSRGAPRLETLPLPPLLVCVAETDILRDRNLELCRALRKAGKGVDQAVYGGVGHAFQVLHNSHLSQPRTQEMLAHIRAFVTARS